MKKKRRSVESIQLEAANDNIQELQLRLLRLTALLEEEAVWLDVVSTPDPLLHEAFRKRAKYLKGEIKI